MNKTCWRKDDISRTFDAYNDYLENMLGYETIIQSLKENTSKDSKILDYGCGGGKVTRRLKEAGFSSLAGVDISSTMIEKARTNPLSKGIEFNVIESGEIPVPDNSYSAIICCYVLINIHSKDEFNKIINELYRVLKSGGYLYILNTNPDTTGIQFSNFQNGEEGVRYLDADIRKVTLKMPEGEDFIIYDTHWETNTYLSSLASSGFSEISSRQDTLNDIKLGLGQQSYHFDNEYKYAPFLIVHAIK